MAPRSDHKRADDLLADFDVESGSEKDFLEYCLKNDTLGPDIEAFNRACRAPTPDSLDPGPLHFWETHMSRKEWDETVEAAKTSRPDWNEFRFLEVATTEQINGRMYELYLEEMDENGPQNLSNLESCSPYLILQKNIEEFAESHPLSTHNREPPTTLERRGFFRDIYDYARASGLSRRLAKIEVKRARAAYRARRGLPGSLRFEESCDDSMIGEEVNDVLEDEQSVRYRKNRCQINAWVEATKLRVANNTSPSSLRKRKRDSQVEERELHALPQNSIAAAGILVQSINSTISRYTDEQRLERKKRKKQRRQEERLRSMVQFKEDQPLQSKNLAKLTNERRSNKAKRKRERRKERRRQLQNQNLEPNSTTFQSNPNVDEVVGSFNSIPSLQLTSIPTFSETTTLTPDIKVNETMEDMQQPHSSTPGTSINNDWSPPPFSATSTSESSRHGDIHKLETYGSDRKGKSRTKLIQIIRHDKEVDEVEIPETPPSRRVVSLTSLDDEMNSQMTPMGSIFKRKNELDKDIYLDNSIAQEYLSEIQISREIGNVRLSVDVIDPNPEELKESHSWRTRALRKVKVDAQRPLIRYNSSQADTSSNSENPTMIGMCASENSVVSDDSSSIKSIKSSVTSQYCDTHAPSECSEFSASNTIPRAARVTRSKSFLKTPSKRKSPLEDGLYSGLQTPEKEDSKDQLSNDLNGIDSPTKTKSEKKTNKKQPLNSPFFSPPLSAKKPKKLDIVPKKPRPKAGTTSCIPFPSLEASNFGLLQEKLANDPFRLLIGVTFLNRTHGKYAIPVFFELMAKYPTPGDLLASKRSEVVAIIKHLGLQIKRTDTYIEYARLWTYDPPVKGRRYRVDHYPSPGDCMDIKKDEVVSDSDPRQGWEIGHITQGRYAIDSWRIFCRDVLRGEATGWNGEGREGNFQPEWMRVAPQDKELRAFLRWMWLKEGYEWDPFTGEKELASRKLQRAAMEGRIAWDEEGGMRILEKGEEEVVLVEGPSAGALKELEGLEQDNVGVKKGEI